jgi:hypothetical protein
MKIIEVKRWKTSDGKEHASKDDAKSHEAELTAIKDLTQLLETSIKTGRPESILKHLLVESEAVRNILKRHAVRKKNGGLPGRVAERTAA